MIEQEIEAKALELYPVRKRMNKKGTGEFDANLPRRQAYIQGYKDGMPKITGDDIIRKIIGMAKMEKRIKSGDSIWDKVNL